MAKSALYIIKGEFIQIDGETDPLKVAILKEIANLAKIRQRLT